MASTALTTSHMAARNAHSTRLARWQPYFPNCNSIPNKKALPSLVRLQPPISPSRTGSTATPLPDIPSRTPPAPCPKSPAIPRGALPESVPAKPCQNSSQLLTPSLSPPGMPPTLLEQTSSGYVLGKSTPPRCRIPNDLATELSLAVLASLYFQPGHQTPGLPSPKTDGDTAVQPASVAPSPSALAEPRTPPPTSRRPPKDITPLTPQSPRPPRQAALPPLPPPAPTPAPAPLRVQSLPSKRELARHLNSLGALEPQSGAAPAGSMRWFLTELFKRAALPGLIIRVAAGYVLRCRAAINHALQSVALKSQQQLASPNSNSIATSPVERTPQERVLTDARRVFLAALVLACKFVFDKPYDNRSWSLISGLGSRDIGECERIVGEVLEWRLWIGAGRAPICPSQQ